MGLRKVEKWTNFGCFLQCSRELGPFHRKTVCTIELDAKRRFRRGTGRRGWKKLIFLFIYFFFFNFVKTLKKFFSALMRFGRICTLRFGVQEGPPRYPKNFKSLAHLDLVAQTDRQTDRQTDGQTPYRLHKPALKLFQSRRAG